MQGRRRRRSPALRGCPAEDADVGSAAGPGGRDQVGAAFAIHIAHRDINASREQGIEREIVGEKMAVAPVEGPDMRSAAGSGASDGVRKSVAVHITRSDKHATNKTGIVSQIVAFLR